MSLCKHDASGPSITKSMLEIADLGQQVDMKAPMHDSGV